MSTSGFNTSFGVQPQNSLGNTLTSEKKSIPEYKKIFCAYHTTEFLTNFCVDIDCLMPLCPTCVVEHTEEHYECGQKPTYVNLHQSLQDSKQKCYSTIVQLEQFSRKNSEISNYLQGLPEYVRKQLYECKEQVYRLIDKKFEALQEELIVQIRQKYTDEGVYNRKECEEVKEYITSQITSQYDKIGQLKGDQCLAALIRYYESEEKGFQHDLEEIQQYIERNQKAGGIFISLNEQALQNEFQNLCEKVINLQYVQPEETKSFNSTFHQHLHSSKKGMMNSSVVNKISASRSGLKDKSGVKKMQNSQLGSSVKNQQKGIYNSPFKPAKQF